MKWKGLFNKLLNVKEEQKCVECSSQFRYTVYKTVFLVIVVGTIIPFATQFCLPMILLLFGVIDVNEYNILKIPGVEIWNQYTGIILGIVATIMSIVSMYLGFKNSDESSASERRTRELLGELDDETKEVLSLQKQLLEKQKDMENAQKEMSQKMNVNSQNISKDISDPWSKESK